MRRRLVTVQQRWKELREEYRAHFAGIKLPKEKKFVSFFRNTLLPRNVAVKISGPYLIENSRKEYLTGRFTSYDSPRNRRSLRVLMRGFYIIYLSLFYIYIINDKRKGQVAIHNIYTFNYFNSQYMMDYYTNNQYIKSIVQGYFLDYNFYKNYINYFNLYILRHIKIFDVLLNFDYFKFEEDTYLNFYNKLPKYGKSKRLNKLIKMRTDYFEYIKRKNRTRVFNKFIKNWKWWRDAPWNKIAEGEDDEIALKPLSDSKILKNHLKYNNNIYFCYIIYEFAIYLNNNILYNFFNIDFFNKLKITESQNNKKKNYPYFLNSLYYTYNLDFLNYKRKRANNNALYTKYKELNINSNKDEFNPDDHIISIKKFGIKMPILLFFLYTFYAIHYRHMRYNFYIRGEKFFNEYPSRMYYFIWSCNSSNAYGINQYKFEHFKARKLFTIYHFMLYVEIDNFNDWFYFYWSYRIEWRKTLDLKKYQHKSSFSLILNDPYIIKLLNVTVEKKLLYVGIFLHFFTLCHYWYELFHGYVYFMNTSITRYETTFSLGLLAYLEFDSLVDHVYYMPADQALLTQYLKRRGLFEHFFKNYSSFYLNLNFLKDLYNLNLFSDFNKYSKIINFYDQILYIVFWFIDPYFFKYFWRRCWPWKMHLLRRVQSYLWSTIVMIEDEMWVDAVNFNVPKYDFLMHYLFWKIETGNFFIVNNFNTIKTAYNFAIINEIYKTRFLNLFKQFNFVLNKNKIYKKYLSDQFSTYLLVLKNYYFSLLYYNVEYFLIFFLIHKMKYQKLLINTKLNHLHYFISSNFIYRYYIYNVLLDTHHYADWFTNWNKRIFWIYKNFWNHEGPNFYDKNLLIIKHKTIDAN